MKIDSNFIYFINLTPKSQISKSINNLFEKYLKLAISEIETKEILQKSERERIHLVYEKLEKGSQILEKVSQNKLDETSSETIGDFLLSQALEINKILKTFPESPLKELFNEWTFFIGVEAQKIKQGIYS